MFNFICTTVVCIQQYLGTGYVPISDRQRFIWDGFNQDYVCAVNSNIYTCSKIYLPTSYWYR
jgi:hypothetical protein